MTTKSKKKSGRGLCEQVALEHDPEKVLALAQEICRLLDEKQKSLKRDDGHA